MSQMFWFLLLAWMGVTSLSAGEAVANLGTPLARAHAHNDYEHERPLYDALANGFCGVEADVHLVSGELLIGHDPEDLQPGRNLQKLYLEPLWEVV